MKSSPEFLDSVLTVSSETGLKQVKEFVGNDSFIVVAHWNKCGHCVELLEKSGLFQELVKHTMAKFIKVELNEINRMKHNEVYKYLHLEGISYYPFIYALNPNPNQNNARQVYDGSSRDLSLMKDWVTSVTSSQSGGYRKHRRQKKRHSKTQMRQNMSVVVATDENIRKLLTTAKERNETITHWDVSQVTNMRQLFRNWPEFNEPLNWDTGNVTNMKQMFAGCTRFNQPLNWNTSKVLTMEKMFAECTSFNQPLNWDTGNVTNMKQMFAGCTRFNQPLNWNTSKVLTMEEMFAECTSFNQPLNWNTGNVRYMKQMFGDCTSFNSELNFDTSNVTDMRGMFYGCTNFNQRLNFDTRNVRYMQEMFVNCTSFNSELNFNTSNVTDMSEMFLNCTSFNQSLDLWDFRRVTNMDNMLDGCTNFHFHERRPVIQAQVQQPEHPGVAFEIHNKFGKFSSIQRRYLEIIHQPDIEFSDIRIYVYQQFTEQIRELFTDDDQTQKLSEFERVFQRATDSKFGGSLQEQPRGRLQLIAKSINFVFSSGDTEFIKGYLINFLNESCYAYPFNPMNPGANRISCLDGVLERFVLAVGNAAEALCITGECKPIYRELDDLMNFKFQLSFYAEKWWQEEFEKLQETLKTPEDRKANFIKYLIENAIRLNQYNEDVELKIKEEAEKIDYAFKQGALGGSRKSRKCRMKSTKKSTKKSTRTVR